MGVKLTQKMINNSWNEFYNQYSLKVKKVPIHIRVLFSSALKEAFKGGFINGFDEYRKKQRGNKK